ncbi:MAG: LysR family transcriptional regulator [Pseudomonadota bacterium]
MQILFDLRELQTFALVAEELSFTAVAARQNTVQSSISAQIKKLESSLGQRLVSRGRGQSMSLTADGEAFLVYAKRILALSAEAVETAQTVGSRQVLRLGTTVTLAMSIVAETLGLFASERPDIKIQIQCDRSERLLQSLEDGDIDIAFMMDQGRHNLRKFVLSMDLAWASSKQFSMPANRVVPLAFLTDGRDLRRHALRALDTAGQRCRVSHLSPHPVGVRTLVQAGLALTIMPAKTIVPPLFRADDALGLPLLPPIALAGYATSREGLTGDDVLIDQLAHACRR